MRMAIALVALTDLSIRLTDLSAHYTNQGLWPSQLIYNFGWNNGYWSLHALYASYSFELFLFGWHVIFALTLLFGFKTRISTVLTWLLYISLHNRNIYILQGGDDLLRITLFWGIFLPWGSYYSLDAVRSKKASQQSITANAAYMLLIASVYLFSALHKTSDDWLKNFDALYYALSLEQLRLPFGDWLLQFPLLLKVLTILVYSIELVIPILILWPQKNGYLRFIAFIFLCLLHIGIGLNLYVGLFFVIGISSAIGFIPTLIVNKLEAKFKIKRIQPEIENFPSPNKYLTAFKKFVILLVVFLCLMLNIGGLPYNNYQLKTELNYPVNVLRLNQNWAMFAPGVLRNDGWFVYYGKDSIGRQWDIRLNQDYVDFSKPQHIVQMYKNDRWRKLAENMQNDNYTFLRSLYCKYRLNEWNTLHPEKKLLSLDLYFMEKINQADYKQSIPVKKLYCSCYVH
jgi:hypothetical protein